MSRHLVDADGDTIMTDDDYFLPQAPHSTLYPPAQSMHPPGSQAYRSEISKSTSVHSGHQPLFYPGSFGLGMGTRFQFGSFGAGASQPLPRTTEVRQPHIIPMTVPTRGQNQLSGHWAPWPGLPPTRVDSISSGFGPAFTQNHNNRFRQGSTNLPTNQRHGGCRACNITFCSLCRTFHDRALNCDYFEDEVDYEDEGDHSSYTDNESQDEFSSQIDEDEDDDDDDDEDEDDNWSFHSANGMHEGLAEGSFVRRAVGGQGEPHCFHCNTIRYRNNNPETDYCDVCMRSSSQLERCRHCFLDLCPTCLRGGRNGRYTTSEPSRRRNGFSALDLLDY
ncbi:hypothetical protein PV10_01781 [Exophiala mesophila]|uniref:Uncharacterized protein n=1 Tax=Exophiala mesophila TaxID=212818 RepID=A0A0D1ZVS8_EXOME|nr:uncharacterized protein PV10_01781 [Exophiala mesophila]KIV98094.1 hypothetical protein PV10_01781 [Exophiala mesophila]